MSNNEESDEDPDQRHYQDELVHKTALFMFCSEESGTLRAGTSGGTNRIGEASGRQGNTLGTCCLLINSMERDDSSWVTLLGDH